MGDRAPVDPAMVNALQADDLGAFEAFYRRYEAAVYRTAFGLVRDAMAAEDVVTEAFLRAYGARGRLDPQRSPLPWLQRITINLALNHLRRRRLGIEDIAGAEAAAADPAPTPDLAAEGRETVAALGRAVDRLPERLRTVTVLRYVDELSLAEIADVLDCPVGTVKSRLHHAMRALRSDLGTEAPAAPSIVHPLVPAVEVRRR